MAGEHTLPEPKLKDAHLHPQPMSLASVNQDISHTRYHRSKSLQQGQRSYQGHTMMNPQPMSLPSNNFLLLPFLRYSPDKIL